MKYCGIVNFQNSFICEEILLRLPPCKHAESIMEEHDYPGLRFTLIGTLDGLRQKVKIDISTGDAITPQVIEYRYPLMFENRSLQIMSYNLETLLAEKLETIMYRGTSKTRMRDFYDIYMLTGKPSIAINDATLYRAFLATRNTRRTTGFIHLKKPCAAGITRAISVSEQAGGGRCGYPPESTTKPVSPDAHPSAVTHG